MIARILITSSIVGVIAIFGVITNLAYPGFSQKQIDRVASINDKISQNINEKQNIIAVYSSNALSDFSGVFDGFAEIPLRLMSSVNGGVSSIDHAIDSRWAFAGEIFDNTKEYVVEYFDFERPKFNKVIERPQFASNNAIYQNDANNTSLVTDILAGIEPATGGADDLDEGNPPSDFGYEYGIEGNELLSKGVLVPQDKTVISSSREGKIKQVYFKNGDHFNKGDVILEYYCEDIKAELEAARAERQFAGKKQLTTSRLFSMELSSELEFSQSDVEKYQAQARKKTFETRVNDCVIRADYDGRVVKRMANDNEYTRTDRVLMEVAANGTLDVEFLLPSKSLRWVNIDAPITITVIETGREYRGTIKQIYGEVDPYNQSIQIRAGLNAYQEQLLPGMSGQVNIDILDVRQAGIRGFLEIKTQ